MRKLLETLGEMRRLQMALWILASAALLLALGADWWHSLDGETQPEPETTEASAAPSGSSSRGARPRGSQRLLVRVVDEGGEPVRGARVYSPLEGSPATPAVEFEPGRHAFSGLEVGKVEIVVELAGNRTHFNHETDKGAAVLEVPTGGRVAVAWSLPAQLQLASGRVMLALEPTASSTDRFEIPVPPGAGNRGNLMVPYVLPGSYLAYLEFWREAGGRPEESAVVVPLTAPIELAVQPRALTRIALGLGPNDPPPPPARPMPQPAPTSTPAPAPASPAQ